MFRLKEKKSRPFIHLLNNTYNLHTLIYSQLMLILSVILVYCNRIAGDFIDYSYTQIEILYHKDTITNREGNITVAYNIKNISLLNHPHIINKRYPEDRSQDVRS